MNWAEVLQAYPEQWVLVEVLAAHDEDHQRVLDQVNVVETCANGAGVWQAYDRWHAAHPQREFYFAYTGRTLPSAR